MSEPTEEEMLDKLDIAFEIHEDPNFSGDDSINQWRQIHRAIRRLIEQVSKWRGRAKELCKIVPSEEFFTEATKMIVDICYFGKKEASDG